MWHIYALRHEQVYLISQVTTSNGQVCWTVKIQNENMVAFKSHSYRVQNQFQQSIKMTMVEMDKQSNNHVKLNNQECSSVLLLLYFQGKINGPGTCWHYRAWGVSLDRLTCGLSPSDLVTCHLHIIVVVMTVAEMSSSTIRQTFKIKSCPHIYLVSLSSFVSNVVVFVI